MRKFSWILVIFAAVVLLILVPLRRSAAHQLKVTTYFQNASGLNAGAPVRVDGVDLGLVTAVRVRPEVGERPIEVLMVIKTSYNLAIPNDSVVSLVTQGVLGPTLVDIDTRHAQGPPVGENGVLKSREVTSEESAQAAKHLRDAIIRGVDRAL
jgi:ABC-type transporter Mla subunit MlaD